MKKSKIKKVEITLIILIIFGLIGYYLYNMYKSQLETLKLKNQKNLILEIENVQVKIFDISKADGVITIKAFLRVSMYDYLINNKTKDVVRGSDQNKLLVDYELTFVKAENDNKEEEICPNCGAPVKIRASATCEYCGSTLTKKASKYVLSKKECIGQRKL